MFCCSILGRSRFEPFLVSNRFLAQFIHLSQGFVSVAGGKTEDSEEDSFEQQRIFSIGMKSQRVGVGTKDKVKQDSLGKKDFWFLDIGIS